MSPRPGLGLDVPAEARTLAEERQVAFLAESNRIEGIKRPVTVNEMRAFRRLLSLDRIWLDDLVQYVSRIEPGGYLRERPGMNVRVGPHVPPRGGPEIKPSLVRILERSYAGEDPYWIHVRYETLHPFTDGNGRSGRAVWAWQMSRQQAYDLSIGFLHLWYYQSLQHSRAE